MHISLLIPYSFLPARERLKLEGENGGEEGRTLTRESKSEFTPRGRDLPTFPLLGCLVLGCNRQAQRQPMQGNDMEWERENTGG